MKKTLRILVVAVVMVLMLCLSSCGAVLDRVFQTGQTNVSAAHSQNVGFLLEVPSNWICTETMVADHDTLTYLVTATLSNSAEDRSNVTAISVATDQTPEEYFNAKYAEQTDLFTQVGEAEIADHKVTGKLCKYTAKYDKEDYTILQCLLPAENGRLCIFTFTAKSEHFDRHYDTVRAVLSSFEPDTFVPPPSGSTEGMQTMTRSEICNFHVSVPGDYTVDFSGVSDYAKAISPDKTMTVSAMRFFPTLEGDITIQNYWDKLLEPHLISLMGDTLVITEEGGTVPFAGGYGAQYAYQGTQNGVSYHFLQIYQVHGQFIHVLTFTSTAAIDPAQQDVAAIIGSFGY